MTPTPRWTYLVFALGAAAVLGALAFVTSHVLRLERREQATQAAAKADESIRLALWRMDSAVNAIIAKEAARPYFEYQPFYAADRAYTKMFDDVRPGEVLVPSPLLLGSGDYVMLHFQRTPDGTITSPQVPTGNMRDLAESAYIDSTAVIAAEDHLRHLSEVLAAPVASGTARVDTYGNANSQTLGGAIAGRESPHDLLDAERDVGQDARRPQATSSPPSLREYEARWQSAELAASNIAPSRGPVQQRLATKGNDAEKDRVGSSLTGTPQVEDKVVALADALKASKDEAGLDQRKEEASKEAPTARSAGATVAAPAPSDGSAGRYATKPADPADPPVSPPGSPTSAGAPPAAIPAPASSASESTDASVPRPTASSTPPPANAAPAPKMPIGASPAVSAEVRATYRRQASASSLDLKKATPPAIGERDRTRDRDVTVAEPSVRKITATPVSPDVSGNFSPLLGLAYQPEPAIELSPFTPAWVGESPRELVFTRAIRTPTTTLAQGLWIDWPRLSAYLQESAKDLVPGALVQPVAALAANDPNALGRRLASIPAELRWTPPAIVATHSWTPARTTLILTWIATLIAIGAIAFVLHSSTDLAERRGRFVSAVTHELRTPLTTFCMYSQMLADGMVTSDDARRDYLQTLKQEASRLSRIVENVLDYARLGRKKKSAPPAPIAATDLLARVEPALRLRCEQSGVPLVVHSAGPSDATVRADPATVERILYNLVDNACKYAFAPPSLPAGEVFYGSSSMTEGASATNNHTSPPPIELSLTLSPRHATFSVRDHGPGIPHAERAHIFKPFHRGPHHSDGSIPGLGLGLALARGLAHTLGGALELAPTPAGTQLDLTLPRSLSE